MESDASHHITSNLQNLSIHNNYEGPKDVNKYTNTFTLNDILCAPCWETSAGASHVQRK
ncbi:hypothetical protein BHM03_00047809 [Ensete ventricosum]|nr:hypothetical protein BHM03_00047809 [Ensete ventricosum]